jgi:hypothetical protein
MFTSFRKALPPDYFDLKGPSSNPSVINCSPSCHFVFLPVIIIDVCSLINAGDNNQRIPNVGTHDVAVRQ